MTCKYKFTDVEFMSARDKELTLKAWVTFIRHGCQWKHFTDRLYKHLSLHCSFIAHYDRAGFYSVYFETDECRRTFFSQFRPPYKSVEYGWTIWLDGAYEDINRAMISELKNVRSN